MEGPQQATPPGPPLGDRLEPGANLEPVEGGLPRHESMRISHEAIYQALFVQSRGTLMRELVSCGPDVPCVFLGLGPADARTAT